MGGQRGKGSDLHVVVLDDNEIYRSGITECCKAMAGIDVRAGDLRSWDDMGLSALAGDRVTLLVEVASDHPGTGDRFTGVDAIHAIRRGSSDTDLQIIATCRVPASRYLALRLSEAGADFYYGPLHSFRSAADLLRMVSDPSEGCRLPTQWALREELGLRWDGDMAEFLRLVATFPDEIWQEGRSQAHLPISRRTIMRLRHTAHAVAGLPSPDARRFSGALREAPVWPEWREVTWLVRTLRGA